MSVASRLWIRKRRIDDDPADSSRYAELSGIYLDMGRYDDALSTAIRCSARS